MYYIIISMAQQPPGGQGPPHYRGFTITLRHFTFGRTPLDEWSARRRDLYLTTHNTQTTTDRHPCPRRDSNPNPSKRIADTHIY